MNEEQRKAIEDAMQQLEDNTGLLKNNEKIQEFVNIRMAMEEKMKVKNPLVKEYLDLFKDAEKRPYTNIGRMAKEMRNVAAKQEILKIAAQLCTSEEAKKELLKQQEKLKQSPAMEAYEKYMQGLQYLAGMTNEVKPQVRLFFEEEMRLPLLENDEEYEKYRIAENDPTVMKQDAIDREYQKLIAPTKARQIFSNQATKIAAIERQFLGDYINDPKRVTGSPYTDRMTPSGYCVGLMLREGYSMEKILDPRALLKEKIEIGKKYIEIRESKDIKRYAKEMYENSEAMIKGVQEYVKKYKDELKTQKDLMQHMSKLGMLARYIHDNSQEIGTCMNALDKKDRELYFKSKQEMTDMQDKLEGFACIVGNSLSKLPYELEGAALLETSSFMSGQMCTNKFLQEIQKGNTDFTSFFASFNERAELQNQLYTMPEMKKLFAENTSLSKEEMTTEDAALIGSMLSSKLLEEKNITYDRARTPVTVTKTPAFSAGFLEDVEKGKKLNFVVSRSGKQIIKTDVPVRMDNYLQTLETATLRGKEKDNSEAFNKLLENYDQTIKNLREKHFNNPEYIREMKALKKAASDYISAKRQQKGYTTEKMSAEKIDDKMLGKGQRAAIFTSEGKERYAFALNILKGIEKTEKSINEFEMKKDKEIELDDNVMSKG